MRNTGFLINGNCRRNKGFLQNEPFWPRPQSIPGSKYLKRLFLRNKGVLTNDGFSEKGRFVLRNKGNIQVKVVLRHDCLLEVEMFLQLLCKAGEVS